MKTGLLILAIIAIVNLAGCGDSQNDQAPTGQDQHYPVPINTPDR